MYLSKIELFGFKSFAHRVKIKFDPGLTAIVGPNGCGKTNVVDAMRWVLGEQKSSLLRSAKMENIIFNGSRNLKPLSLTEVSLTIENNRNVLPIEYTEVTVTRRLYRNGESEFMLNMVPCRLRDILDIFTDTGMGSDAYSVIELKMIEEIISNKSEERLKLFEEAAGITRYKQRRKQSFKLLESTSLDLSRVDDVVAEVEKKVRSLKLQVRKAEKLRELKKRIRDLDLALSWLTMEELREKLEPMQRRIREEEGLNHADATAIATEESAAEERELLLLKEESALSEGQKRLNGSNQRIHTLEKALLQHEEQQKNLVSDLARFRAILRSREQKCAEEELRERELLRQKAPGEAACIELHEAFLSLVAEYDALNDTLGQQREMLERERRLCAEEQSEANHLALKKHSLESKREYLRSTIERLEAKEAAIEEKMKNSLNAEEELQREIEHKKSAIAKAKRDEEGVRERLERLKGRIGEMQEATLLKRSERERVHNQILLANSVLDNFEGMPEGIGFLEKQKSGNAGLGCLSDLLSLESSCQKAVNAALGDSMSYYLCQSLQEAKEGIANLRSSNKGKVHFLVLDLVSESKSVDYPEIAGAQKTVELITYPPELHHALLLMLGKSYVVADLNRAESLAMLHPDCSFVTSEGEKFAGRALLLGGSSKNSEGLRLGRKALREKLQKELVVVEQSIIRDEDALLQLRKELGSIRADEGHLEVERLGLELGTLEKRATRLDAEESANKREREQTEAERMAMVAQKAACEAEVQTLLPAISSKAGSAALFSEKIRLLQENLTTLESRHHLFGREVQSRQSRYKDALRDLEKLNFTLATSASNKGTLQEEMKRLNLESAAAEKKLGMGKSASEGMKNELEALLLGAAKEQKRVGELSLAYRERQAQHHTAQTTLRELRRKHDLRQQLLATLTHDAMELEQSLDHLFLEAQVKYNCDLAVMAEPALDHAFEHHEAIERLTVLNRQREQFGAVNELALDEYEVEKERLDFLVGQREDLLKAERELRSTIEEINRAALQKFEATFREVRKNFIALFRELFELEDEADLLIHTGEDPLDAHIEIVAKPRGKKPLSIEQLSGGEKALTALSLLFAIYLVKPSPFCILDEVDAPLDDANVTRFIKLLKKFENNTQFIIVTHNKKTMASCHALYGVTMEEEGVSRLIPVRLEKIRI